MVPLLYHSEGHSKYQQHKSGQLVKNVLLAVLNQTWISQRFSSEHLPFAICIQSPFLSARAYRASRIKDHRKSVTLGANWQPVPERSHRAVVFDIFCHYYIIPKPREIGQWIFQFMTGSSTTAESIMHQNHYSNWADSKTNQPLAPSCLCSQAQSRSRKLELLMRKLHGVFELILMVDHVFTFKHVGLIWIDAHYYSLCSLSFKMQRPCQGRS